MRLFFGKLIILAILLNGSIATAQYTDVINSNRPGSSMSSFGVGKRVFQMETGFSYRNLQHKSFNNSAVQAYALDAELRFGLFKEQLELLWDVSYQFDKLSNNTVSTYPEENRNGFLRNLIGAKYLVYDPLKDEDREINIRSWKANHGFHWKDLIPAVALYAGANLNLTDSPYDYYNQFNLVNIPFYYQLEEPKISPKVAITTQSNFAGYWVLVTNFSYNRIGTDYPEMGYVVTLTHSFMSNTRLSIFAESQGFKSDVYADNLIKGGFAYLIGRNFQVDTSVGGSTKETPSQINLALGLSFRIDNHMDEIKTSQEKSNKELSGGKKKKVKKKKVKKAKKNKEDTEEPTEEEE